MLSTLIAATLAQTPVAATVSAADFFPLTTGTRRYYEEKLKVVTQNIDLVGKPVQIGGEDAIPVDTQVQGRTITTTFYRVSGNTVYLVANDIKHPLPKPIPILQVDSKPSQWSFEGPSNDDKWAEGISMQGASKMVPDRDVFGKKLPILEVKLVTTIGSGPNREVIEQTASYAKGVGLVDLVSKTTVAKRSASNQLRLIRVEEAVAPA